MPYEWGPHFIVASETLKKYSGTVRLREKLDEDFLRLGLKELGFAGLINRIANPWYNRKKGSGS